MTPVTPSSRPSLALLHPAYGYVDAFVIYQAISRTGRFRPAESIDLDPSCSSIMGDRPDSTRCGLWPLRISVSLANGTCRSRSMTEHVQNFVAGGVDLIEQHNRPGPFMRAMPRNDGFGYRVDTFARRNEGGER